MNELVIITQELFFHTTLVLKYMQRNSDERCTHSLSHIATLASTYHRIIIIFLNLDSNQRNKAANIRWE